MSTKEEKEKQQKTLDKEKYKRDKQIAILKASNQMLEDAKENIRAKWSDDPMKLEELLDEVDIAKDENLQIGKNYLHANEDEINASQYKEVSNAEVEKYKRHLEKRGITDEEMHAKSSDDASGKGAKVIISSDSKKEKEGKWFSFRKKKNEVDSNGEEVVTDIDQAKRTVVGEGYVPTGKEKETPEKFMKQMAEKNEEKRISVTNEQINTQSLDVNDKIEQKLDIKGYTKPYEYPEFDPSTISPLTRYDIIELPSHGECYSHKKGRIPVRELTASDENLIASPNMYANGMLIETILRRCILDKNFNVDEMCPGDRDAVVMWLRATAYGPEYNVSAVNPDNGKTYKSTINLSDFQFKPFDLKGDENGYFDYTFENGDIAKFKVLSFKDVTNLQEEIALQYINQKKYIVYQKINDIKYQVDEVFKDEIKDDILNDAIDYIYEWANKDSVIKDEETLYSNFITSGLVKRTVSINGNKDKEFIESYINNLRISEARKFREFILNNTPGIDFSITIEIPESDGGGSFESSFQYGETIFIS